MFKPYNKTNSIPQYVNAKSNHPPSILKEIPKSVSKRISSNSCNEQVFNAATPFYNDILDKCGYSERFTFEKEQYTLERRNRGRNINCYNPPFSKNVKTNIAKQFLYFLDKHFGRNHKYHKIFNRNNVKISYSCMDNVKNIISSHNKRIINSGNEANGKTCNYRNKSICPLDNKCLINKIVYKGEIEINNDTNELSTKFYFGISKTEFKSRYNNHKMSFRNRTHENDTELSKYIWSLKDENKDIDIKWSILKKSFGYGIISKSFNLFLLEKLVICRTKKKKKTDYSISDYTFCRNPDRKIVYANKLFWD